MRLSRWLLALLLAVLVPTPAWGVNTYYISPTGSDTTGDGSTGNPWKTFAKFLTVEQPGDTLYLKDGNYTTASGGAGRLLPNCTAGGNGVNGTSAARITVQAENERQAIVASDGLLGHVFMFRCSFWDIRGLVLTSQDNASATGNGWFAIQVSGGTNVRLYRNLLYRGNRYPGGSTAIGFTGGGSSHLAEENEAYDFDRNVIYAYDSDGIVFRRNFCRPRSTGRGPDPTPGAKGPNDCYLSYSAKNNIFENNIAVGPAQTAAWAIGSKPEGPNFYYGNIVLNWTAPAGILLRGSGTWRNNVVLFAGAAGIAIQGAGDTPRFSPYTWLLENNSVFNATTGHYIDCDNGAGVTSGITIRNGLVGSASGAGLRVLTASECNARVFEYTAGYASPMWGSNTETRDTATTPPTGVSSTLDVGACRVWIPTTSSLHGRGKDGADIGANILYRYEDGTLTTEPLWDPGTGNFPAGAVVTGINDSGITPATVDASLNVNANGCSFPTGYASDNSAPTVSITAPTTSTDVSATDFRPAPGP
jgi:hypothetical protein